MRANFIIGKRQIILASLVVVLGAAVYLNWQFAGNDKISLTDTQQTSGEVSVLETDANTPTDGTEEVVKKEDESKKEEKDTEKKTEKTNSGEQEKHLGDSLLVSSTAISADDYFAKAKLTKVKTRDEAIETISTILNDEKLKEEDKKGATDTAISLTNTMEVESKIENLIKSKGFEECIVYLGADTANVVVKTEGLNADLATQIKNIVLAEGQVLAENISITELF